MTAVATKPFRKHAKQKEAIDLFINHVEPLIEGGSRSGKTFIEIYVQIVRGLKFPGTKHLSLRKHFNHAKTSLWYQTIPDVFKKAFPDLKYKTNKSDWFIEFGEGSQLWIAGTDDKERVEKILGTEWATIFLNEISEQSYETYELLKTRLNPPAGMRPLLMLDQNPPKKSHWSHLKFHQGLDPTTKQPLTKKQLKRQAVMKINPKDNIDNLNEAYIEGLESLSEAKRKRFLLGEYGDDNEKALWRSLLFHKHRRRELPDNLHRIVVAVDPNVTEDKKVNEYTDEAGIITVGQFLFDNETHYLVIRDDTTPGLSWGEVVCQVYADEKADRVIGEVNNGGDLIEMNIRNYDKNISYESVRATRGKEIRAQPVADLYRRGFVHHLGELPELEGECTTWIPGEGRSPNRLDALVWAISYLAGLDDNSGEMDYLNYV